MFNIANDDNFKVFWKVIFFVLFIFWGITFSFTENLWIVSLGSGTVAVVANELWPRICKYFSR